MSEENLPPLTPSGDQPTPVKRKRGRPSKADKAEQAASVSTGDSPSAAYTAPAASRLTIEEAPAENSYEWSPSASAKPRRNAGRPRREAASSTPNQIPDSAEAARAPRDNDEEIPTSFKASPTDNSAPSDAPATPAVGDNQTPNNDQPSASADSSGQQGQRPAYGRFGRHQQWRDRKFGQQNRPNQPHGQSQGQRFDRFGGQQNRQGGNRFEGQQRPQGQPRFERPERSQPRVQASPTAQPSARDMAPRFELVEALPQWELFADLQALEAAGQERSQSGQIMLYSELVALPLMELAERAKASQIAIEGAPHRERLLESFIAQAATGGLALHAEGVVDRLSSGDAVLVFGCENYNQRPISPYICKGLCERYGIKPGTTVKVQLLPAREGSRMPIASKVLSVMGQAPEANLAVTPFEELTAYYPTRRLLLETGSDAKWDNLSMRVVDLLTPIGFGQRGLIVAPPRTGKTVLMQGIANAIAANHPEAHLMVLLVDERPEEVTDFKRQVKGEVISSTFDQTAQSHVHAAEIVIEKARRSVERGEHVIVLLDSITRLARAYNALTGNSGKIMSGGVESNALQRPKRFFGSARNIENGGSLTILGTALVDTGSKMDEVIFEEFKGTGNMELHLDRGLVDKRIFPAIALDKSGTRKEELLYHPDETPKVYGLRRAMKGITPIEAMEMLITRIKKTRTNIEFLMGLSR
jgi:transcription termination factor Rho